MTNSISLQLYDGPNTNASMIGKYCGSTLPSSIMTSGRTLYLRFKADASGVGNGFRANYQTIGVSKYLFKISSGHDKSIFSLLMNVQKFTVHTWR